jgi:hypothetical protein
MQGLGSQVCGIRYGPRNSAQAQTAAGYAKKAQPQGELRCTYETTNKPNKPNTIIDSAAAIVFNRNLSQKRTFLALLQRRPTPYPPRHCCLSPPMPGPPQVKVPCTSLSFIALRQTILGACPKMHNLFRRRLTPVRTPVNHWA